MSRTTNRREIEQKRKHRFAILNHGLGWLTLITFLLPQLVPLLEGSSFAPSPDLVTLCQSLFMFGIFIHGLLGIYIYGVPEVVWHPRVMQMMLGFIILAVFILNRSFIKVPVLQQITNYLLWLPIGLHALLGLRYLLHRWLRSSTYSATPYYLGGALVRDFTREI